MPWYWSRSIFTLFVNEINERGLNKFIVFDNEFIPASKLGHTKWKHEQGSVMMFKYLIEDNKEDLTNFGINLDNQSIETVINMIEGTCPV